MAFGASKELCLQANAEESDQGISEGKAEFVERIMVEFVSVVMCLPHYSFFKSFLPACQKHSELKYGACF